MKSLILLPKTSTVSRKTKKRLSLISNMQIKSPKVVATENTSYLDLGDYKYYCEYCGTLFWFDERSNVSGPPTYNLCCQKNKVKLPLLKESPPILDHFLSCNSEPETIYYQNIYIYIFVH